MSKRLATIIPIFDARGLHRASVALTGCWAPAAHSDLLRVITAIFDDNGNVLAGGEKDLTMDLTATQYQQLLQVGLTVNSTFDLKPGKYLVRQLIEDTASGETSARNQAIEIAESVAH